MSGYLHRLALGVLKPGGSIQPLRGSVFSPPEPAFSPMPFPGENVQAAAPGRRSEPEPIKGPREIPPAPPQEQYRRDREGELAASQDFQTVEPDKIQVQSVGQVQPLPAKTAQPKRGDVLTEPETRVSFRPLLEKTVDDRETKMAPHDVATSRDFQKTYLAEPNAIQVQPVGGLRKRPVEKKAQPALANTSLEPALPVTVRLSSAAESVENPMRVPVRAFTPLLPTVSEPAESVPRQERSGLEVEPSPPKTGLVRNFQNSATFLPAPLTLATDGRERIGSRHTEQARIEPDEIQIHIGRIEVVAVPPARPAPVKPRRGASSLAEYLRRRDGKTA